MRSFWAALPTEGRWLLSTVAIQTLGRGLTLPFTIIYLHEVRGFDLGLSGTLMGLIAISGFAATGPGGSLTDRYGARAILLGGLSAMIVGNVLLASRSRARSPRSSLPMRRARWSRWCCSSSRCATSTDVRGSQRTRPEAPTGRSSDSPPCAG